MIFETVTHPAFLFKLKIDTFEAYNQPCCNFVNCQLMHNHTYKDCDHSFGTDIYSPAGSHTTGLSKAACLAKALKSFSSVCTLVTVVLRLVNLSSFFYVNINTIFIPFLPRPQNPSIWALSSRKRKSVFLVTKNIISTMKWLRKTHKRLYNLLDSSLS